MLASDELHSDQVFTTCAGADGRVHPPTAVERAATMLTTYPDVLASGIAPSWRPLIVDPGPSLRDVLDENMGLIYCRLERRLRDEPYDPDGLYLRGVLNEIYSNSEEALRSYTKAVQSTGDARAAAARACDEGVAATRGRRGGPGWGEGSGVVLWA